MQTHVTSHCLVLCYSPRPFTDTGDRVPGTCIRKRDIHVSISHSEGCRESRRRGNETQLIMEKGNAVGWCGAGGNYIDDDSVGSDEEVPFLLTNENAGSRPIRWLGFFWLAGSQH